MKRALNIFLLLTMVCLGVAAQNNPNRLLVVKNGGSYDGYLVERIDSLVFRQIDGEVAADIEFKGFKTGATGDTINLAITKTEECWSYQITVIPNSVMNYLSTEASLASYIQGRGGQRYFDDFTNAEMTGFDFKFQADADYTIATLGYDQYGIACTPKKVSFRTPAPEIVGNPDVECTVLDVTQTTFTIKFVPNDDVTTYSCCSFLKGEAQQQFDMFGAMFGFASIGQMVYSWGIPTSGEYVNEWRAMKPGTEYEVLVQPLDINGNYAPLVSVPVTTLSRGGTGVAEVTITVGDFLADPENGALQEIIFTPNSEVGVYHTLLITNEYYNEAVGDEKAEEYMSMATNPFNPWDSYWDLYDTDASVWQLDYNTAYVALARAKNANGEWGPLAKVEFSTPANDAAAAPSNKQPQRKAFGVSEGTTKPVINIKDTSVKKGVTLK